MTSWAKIVLTLAAVADPGLAQTVKEKTQPEFSSLAHFLDGEDLLRHDNAQSAALQFNNALKGDHRPEWIVVWSHIDLGRIFDATGQRDRAIREYQSALATGIDAFGALDLARAYMDKPAPADEVFNPRLPSEFDDSTVPKVITRVEPEYTAEALLARLEGTVTIAVSVAGDGSTTDLRILKSLGLGLDEAALDAARNWKFAPATLHGKPVPQGIPITLEFRLPSRVPGWHVTKIGFTKPEGAARPTLLQAAPFPPDRMNPDLAEEASIDAAMSRVPDASVSMEIDTSGNPRQLQINAASMPIWGDDAVRALMQWRFNPALQGGTAIAVPCSVQLAWFAP